MNADEFEVYAENMYRLVDSIRELYSEPFANNSLEKLWILTSSPALGNLTLRLYNLRHKKKVNYRRFIDIFYRICEKKIPICLICYGDADLYKFYDSAETKYLKNMQSLRLEKRKITESVRESLDQANALIQTIAKNNERGYTKLENIPDLSIWACKVKANDNLAEGFRAIFDLTVPGDPPMEIKAFNVNDTKLSKFLIDIIESKKK